MNRRSFRHVLLLSALILIGAILRFSYLDQPPIWFDEAATYARTAGSYQQMLDMLEEAGFGPLHYHIYWWMQNGLPTWFKVEPVKVASMSFGEGFPHRRGGPRNEEGQVETRNLVPQHPLVASGKIWMTPFYMRLVPAICGTLMIPAMYWLALELAGGRRNVALLAATLTCFSAYLLNYSRDAKMYQELWLMATLNVAAFLWWLRARGGVAWWMWVVTGTAMIGLQLLGTIAIVVELLIVLTAPRAHWKSFLWIWMLPTIYVARVGRWLGLWNFDDVHPNDRAMRFLRARIERFRWPTLVPFLLGLSIISFAAYGYFGVFNRYAKNIQEVGWGGSGLQWVPYYNAGRDGPELVRYAASAFVTGWEWPRGEDESVIRVRTLRLMKTGFIAILVVAAIGLLPWPKRPPAPLPADRKNRPIDSLVALWLILWLVLPAYAVYCASFKRYASPGDWIALLHDVWRGNTWPKFVVPMAALVGIACAARTWKLRAIRFAEFCGVVVAIGFACWGAFRFFIYLDAKLADSSFSRHESIWIPRYIGMTIPALFIILAVLIARLPTRLLRIAAVLVFVAVNLGQFGGRVFAGNEPPVDRMVRDAITWRDQRATTKMYYNVQHAPSWIGMGPGSGVLGMPTSRYYWAVYTQTPVAGNEIRGFGGRTDNNFPSSTFGSIANSAKADVARNAKLTHLIVWDSIPRGQMDLTDKVLDALGPEWKRETDELFHAREHWTWRELFIIRRREYLKTSAPAPALPDTLTTQPANVQARS